MNFRFCLYTLFSLSLLGASPPAIGQGWSLDSCVRYAFQHNPGLQSAALNVEMQEVSRQTAVGGLLPSLNAQANHGYNWGQRIDPFTNQFATQRVQSNNLGIATSVNIFSGFQQINTVKQARLDVETATWQLEKSKNDLALNVAAAYLTVLLNRELLLVAQSNVDNTLAQVRRMEIMVRNGQMADGNLDQMNAQLASDQSNEVSATNNYELSVLNLVQLMQLPAELRSGFSVKQPRQEELVVSEILSDPQVAVRSALSNFPEIRAAQTSLASAEYGERIASGGRYPRITASYSYGSGYSGAARVLKGRPDSLSFPIGTVIGSNQLVLSFPQPVIRESDYAIKPFNEQLRDNINQALFFNLTFPIFNGFQTSGAIRRAEIARRNAELNLVQSRNQLSQEVERAFADARAALAVYNASVISREASERAFRWTETRFEQGLTNLADFANARGNLDIARANESRNKCDYVFKVKVLDFYLGKPISLK